MYSKITCKKSPSYCMTTFRAVLTNLMELLLSHDLTYYVSSPVSATPPLWMQKHTDLDAHDFVHSSDSWHQAKLANITCARSRRLCGITPSISFMGYGTSSKRFVWELSGHALLVLRPALVPREHIKVNRIIYSFINACQSKIYFNFTIKF